jgi:hypothetical protein
MSVYVVTRVTAHSGDVVAVFKNYLKAEKYVLTRRTEPAKRPYPVYFLEEFKVQQ